MAFTATIEGVSKTLERGWQIEDVVNGRATLTAEVASNDGSYRPALGDEIVLSDTGTPIFGGYISQCSESGRENASALTDIVTRITAADYNGLVERRFVTGDFAEESLEARLTTLVDDYLADYGVTLDGAQVTGPTLPARSYDYAPLTDVLAETMALTGASGATPYVYRIDASKVFSSYQPGSVAAPFNLTDSSRHLVADVTVEPSRDAYANRVLLRCGASKVLDKTDTFTGDGSEDTFALNYPIIYNLTGVGYGYVTCDGSFETLSNLGEGGTWEYDPILNAIIRSSPPDNADAISITYPAQLPFTVVVEDAGEITAEGIWERAFTDESIEDREVGEAMAESILASALDLITTVYYTTLLGGLVPGMTQTINLTRRNVNASFLLSEVTISNNRGLHATRSVKALSDGRVRPGFRDIYKQWAGETTTAGAGAIVAGGGIAGSQTVLAAPFYLGGSRNTSIALSSATWTPVVDFVEYVATASFTGLVRATIWARNASVGVTARLRNVTDATDVESSEVTSQTPTDVTISSAIVAGKTYRLELLSDTNDSGVYGIGTLEAA